MRALPDQQGDAILAALAVKTQPFALCELGPHGRLPMAAGPAATLHYVLSGSGEFVLDGGAPLTIAAGALLLVPAGRRHSISGQSGAAVTLASCQPAALGLAHYRSGEPGQGLAVLCGRVAIGLRGENAAVDLLRTPLFEPAPASGSSATVRALDLVVQELSDPRLGSRAMVCALLLECLIDLLRRRLSAGDPALGWLPALVDRRLWPALKAMLDAPGAPHTVESLADQVAMSRSRFAERFRSAYGDGPMSLLRELRLAQAARMLADTDLGVDRIAARAGYASRSYFTRQFEARYGATPTGYRKAVLRFLGRAA